MLLTSALCFGQSGRSGQISVTAFDGGVPWCSCRLAARLFRRSPKFEVRTGNRLAAKKPLSRSRLRLFLHCRHTAVSCKSFPPDNNGLDDSTRLATLLSRGKYVDHKRPAWPQRQTALSGGSMKTLLQSLLFSCNKSQRNNCQNQT